MATPKTITQLTERSGDLALTDEIEVQVSGATSTVKKALSYIKKLVIGTATIGGSATTDIPTLASVGTFTNKRHTNPKINSATDMYITGDAINNYMQTFITYNVSNDFIRIAGLTSNAQDQLDAHAADILQNANDIADLPTLASVGTFTNKRLNSPLLNSVTPVTVYGEWLNTWLTALQTYNSVNDLIRLAGVTSSIQDQLDANDAATTAVDQRVDDLTWAQRYDYTLTAGAGSSSIDISDTTILTSLSLTGYVDHRTVIIAYYDTTGGRYEQLASSGIIVNYKTVGAADYLDKVTFAVTSGHSYSYYINFKLA